MTNQSVRDKLGQFAPGTEIYYKPNPGNAGDSLIAAATFQLFEAARLQPIVLTGEDFDARGKIVLFGGGGNLIGLYPDARDFIARHHSAAKELVLLPHTVAENEGLLRSLGSNVTLFARERVSYEFLQRTATGCNVFIDDDLALHLDVSKLLAARTTGAARALARGAWLTASRSQELGLAPPPRTLLHAMRVECQTIFRSGIGNFFRQDAESTTVEIPANNVDLSLLYYFGTDTEDLCYFTAKRLLRYLNRFQLVRTNRLHICIGAALLGKLVEFYPNSYFKCRAVYEQSLKDRFPGVKWCE